MRTQLTGMHNRLHITYCFINLIRIFDYLLVVTVTHPPHRPPATPLLCLHDLLVQLGSEGSPVAGDVGGTSAVPVAACY